MIYIYKVDEFDNKIESILPSDSRIVVYVDDLDRVVPEVAREVLDNLRIFFDKCEFAFVVTGDHSVLEQYIGSQILTGNPTQQKIAEEGRRYLKKIFNLYWGLPRPIEAEFIDFAKDKLNENSKTIDKYFTKNRKEVLTKYLVKYFERNYRQCQVPFFCTLCLNLNGLL